MAEFDETQSEDDGGVIGGVLDGVTQVVEDKAHDTVDALQVLREALEEQAHSGVTVVSDAAERGIKEVDELIGRVFDVANKVVDVAAK